MALGNEASTGPRIARLEVANSLGATNNGGRWRAEVATRPLPILLNGPPYGGGIIVQAELPNGSMNLCAVALVKQDWENDHLSTWRTALSAQPNGSSESWTSRLKICAITTKWHRCSESVKRRYSYTTSSCWPIILLLPRPVGRLPVR